MNCEEYQDKLIVAPAGGEGALGGELAVHLRECTECKKFYEAQFRLFGAIDSGVRAMVNETVPASLLPRVRARMEEVRTPRLVWRPAWSVVAIAAMILVVSLGFVRRSGPLRDAGQIKSPIGVAIRTETVPFTATPRKAASAAVNPRRRPGPGNKTEMRIDRPTEVPEVIVLAEEREAFVRFVARIPVDPQKAVALTRPAPPQQDLPVEIALLEIEKLKVKLLEPTAEE
jgi:hypothetical protein